MCFSKMPKTTLKTNALHYYSVIRLKKSGYTGTENMQQI